jgi:rare lipoprotein A
MGMAAALFLLAACSSGPDTLAGAKRQIGQPYSVNGATYVPREEPGYDVVGIASWYGRRYHGRRTASGEIFDMNSATAAHPTLPFGTRVQVTNLENGRSVVLKINDRGPFVRRRIIDVSRRAAQALGFVQNGTARVRVQLVQPAPG